MPPRETIEKAGDTLEDDVAQISNAPQRPTPARAPARCC